MNRRASPGHVPGRRRSPWSRRRGPAPALRAVLLGLLSVCLLSSCAVIPSTGPVVAGRVTNGDPPQSLFQVLPEGPVPGASAIGVVAGFLRAAAGFSNQHEVARSFLTPQRQLLWKPDTTVDVYPSESSVTLNQTGGKKVVLAQESSVPVKQPAEAGDQPDDHPQTATVTVRTPVVAAIDGDRRYQTDPPGQSVTRTFTLVRSGGEWRISALDDGILVAALDFVGTFRSFTVYFFDPSGHFLVPDVHWFADTGTEPGYPELPTALVRQLLEGPPEWLKGAVMTAAPPGTQLAVGAVAVSADDVATVDLTGQVRQAGARQRQLLLSQLEATLRQLNDTYSAQITVQRLAFDVPSGPDTSADLSQTFAQPVADPQVGGGPVVIDGKGRLARLSGRTLTPVKTAAGQSVPGANRPAVNSDGSEYAVLNGARSELFLQLPGATALSLVKGADLSAPSFDPLGWVWTSPAADDGWVYAATSATGSIKVSVPWLKGHDVVSLRISRDGARAVVAARFHGQAHLFLTGVVRDGQGQPESLTPPLGLIPDLETVKDVAWVNEDHVVVLGRRHDHPDEQPWVVQLGGTIQAAAAVPGADSIAAGNGESSLLVGTPKGIDSRSGALWDRITTARWPAFPG